MITINSVLFRHKKKMKKTKEQISYNMRRVKNKDSEIELLLRKELWKRGFRYKKNAKNVFGHPFENRAISVREAARIQTFPDDYVFGESLTKAALEIGNAVPVRFVKASGEVFLNIITKLSKYND